MPNPENIIKHQMKPGETLNPEGRPKGSRNRSTIALKWLEAGQKFKNPITEQEEVLTQEDILTLAMIKEARKGNANAYKVLMDSGYGAAIQKQELQHSISERQSFKIGDQVIYFWLT